MHTKTEQHHDLPCHMHFASFHVRLLKYKRHNIRFIFILCTFSFNGKNYTESTKNTKLVLETWCFRL
jgi:hypothetical protein